MKIIFTEYADKELKDAINYYEMEFEIIPYFFTTTDLETTNGFLNIILDFFWNITSIKILVFHPGLSQIALGILRY